MSCTEDHRYDRTMPTMRPGETPWRPMIVLGIVGAQPILARAEGRATGRPDIVLILTDDQRVGHARGDADRPKRLAERGCDSRTRS